jgi:hypothetical protein
MTAAPDTLVVLDSIPTEKIPAAITRLSARLLAPELADDLLSVKEAAKLIRQSERWLRAHADELGGSRLSRKHLVFSRRTLMARVARKARRS